MKEPVQSIHPNKPALPLSLPATSTAATWQWSPMLAAGPFWPSFEKFRTGGSTAIESIQPGQVATLQTKKGVYRVVRDDDFQKLLGLASEVHRIKGGITIVIQAARVVAKHKDQESLELLINSVSLLSESRILPERSGHAEFQLPDEDLAEHSGEDFDLADIKRPSL